MSGRSTQTCPFGKAEGKGLACELQGKGRVRSCGRVSTGRNILKCKREFSSLSLVLQNCHISK